MAFHATRNKVAISNVVTDDNGSMRGIIQSRGSTTVPDFEVGLGVFFSADYASVITVEGESLTVVDDEDVLGIVPVVTPE